MKRPFILGITGSIGMGKSTVSEMFAAFGIAVWGADAQVHQLYNTNCAVIDRITTQFPNSVINGQIDREKLAQIVVQDHAALGILENILAPHLRQSRADFIAARADEKLVVFDIPLLFEKNLAGECDAVLVISVDKDTQRARVLARPNMDQARFDFLHQKQMPDAEKRALADYVIESYSLEKTRSDVQNLIEKLTGK